MFAKLVKCLGKVTRCLPAAAVGNWDEFYSLVMIYVSSATSLDLSPDFFCIFPPILWIISHSSIGAAAELEGAVFC
jgi:hypothetical protein